MTTLADIIKHAYVHSHGFRSRMNAAGLSPDEITQATDLSKLPVLKKDKLPELQQESLPFAGFTAGNLDGVARVFMSPGPIYDPQGDTHDFWRFSEALEVAGFTKGDIVQNTFSYHFSPAGFMFDSALRKLGAIVIPAGPGNRELQLQALKDLEVTGYVGTPSFFKIILEAAEEKGFIIGRELKLKKAFFTAEMVAAELRASCEEAGISVYEGYGTADCGLIAYEDKQGPGLRVTNTAFVQICDPYSGEPIASGEGEVVVTVFDKTYPLIRFGTGDLSRWVDGYEGERLAGILGRVSDGVKVKGMFVREKQLASALEDAGFARFQARVTRGGDGYDTLEVKVEAEDELPEDLPGKLQEVIRVRPVLSRVEPGTLAEDEKRLVDERVYDVKSI